MKRMSVGGAPPVQWGDASALALVDIEKLSRSKLKRHLEARNESTAGNKRQLLERLKASLEEERLRVIALEEELESKHRQVADLEEMGAVYVVGSNNKGQLGLGDLDHREQFTVIPVTRGLGIHHVSSNESMTFGVAKNHRVYTWGAGVGPMGLKRKERSKFESPQLIDSLEDEEVVMTCVGASHACAISEGGDCFVWGNGNCGALGLGNFENHEKPVLLNTIRTSDEIKYIDSGESHTCALTREAEVYTWGYAASGRLGLGKRVRNGVSFEDRKHFPVPSIVNFPQKLPVRMISCGPEHSLALTDLKVFSWGAGDSGKLGHGDFEDRWEPCEISALNGWHVMDISCGTWHSACVVVVPPMAHAGWVYTWGSGFHGQLGQGKTTVSPKPALVADFCSTQVLVRRVVCGRNHNAVISNERELYTWGSNTNNCLGRVIDEKLVEYTPHPGHCGGFGAIVDRIGRGFPRSVACGTHFTVVATSPYEGPTEQAAMNLMEEHEREELEKRLERERMTQIREREAQEAAARDKKREEIMFLTSRRFCTLDPTCPGFQVHAEKPSICKECGHSSAYHTITVKPDGQMN